MEKEIIEFLKGIPPFQFLDARTLNEVASNISFELYPKGTMILRQDGPASEYLRIIKKGGVKVFLSTAEGEEVTIDYRGEGESFGLLSLVGGDKSRANVIATEDTICYLVKKDVILKLLDTNADFTEYFLKSFFNKFIDKVYGEMRNKSLLYSGGDKILFTTTLGDIIAKPAVTALKDITIREAAELMSNNRISSLVILDPDGNVPVGIVTDRDLRDKVVAKARDANEPVGNIMSRSLIKAEARDYCFDALLKMVRYGIHHLIVVDKGELKGVITNHDLMMLQGTSPISIAREIEGQKSVEGIIPVSEKTNRIIELLMREGARAINITRIITEINDRIVKRLLEIIEERLGPPPLNYCWIVFGSEGRKEQTFRTDQDNAIIYEDPRNEAEAERARIYFKNLGLFMKDALIRCGFPPCPADYMASNPKWCQPLSVWKDYFSGWISKPTPEAILFSLIFFDFRPIYGNLTLSEKLRAFLTHRIKNQNIFLATMAGVITKNRPPLGLFGSFVVEKKGEHKNELNIKHNGIGIIVDAVRLFSLEKGVTATSTVERLRELKDKHPVISEYGEEIEQALEFLMLLRLHHQFEQIHSGKEPDNFINPVKLSVLERNTLKESFRLLSRIHDFIVEQYRPGMVGQ